MQPPTEPTRDRTGAARGDEDRLYRQHHRDLHRAVARVVRAPRELIEDACQTAWATLLRTQPDRYAIFAWLRVVAIHEAYRLAAIDRRAVHLERLNLDEHDWQELNADPRTLDELSRLSKPSARWRRCRAPAPRPHAQDRRLQLRGDPRPHAGANVHQRQQVARQSAARGSAVRATARR
jgi:hypothetical protein